MKRTDITPTAENADSSAPISGASPPTSAASAMPDSTKGLSPAVQKHIGNLLKVSYQNLLTEPVPDRFTNLLEQLDQAEKSKPEKK